MHQHRRRKKRPSYGVRTVEVSRGKNGFGFTISGQAPCILSCIITGSPAEKAGLRPGDFLIAVNGQNVSKAPHDDVVRFIGNSDGVLKLQIAENYYSDSSEEEFVSIIKLRPKYPYKVRNRQQQNVCRAEKVVQDLQTGALFIDHIYGNNVVIEIPQQLRDSKISTVDFVGHSQSNKALLDLILQQRTEDTNINSVQGIPGHSVCTPSISSTATKSKLTTPIKREAKISKSHSHPEHLNLNTSGVGGEIFHSIFTEQDLNNILYPAIFASQNLNDEQKNQDKHAILKAVVGYLGTIEMPKEPQFPNSRLQTIRNCIRRLRIEKKVHTLVLMTVFPESIILINPQRITLAEFSADKITFSGVYSDDKKFFGLVTNHGNNCDEFNEGIPDDTVSISSSCHVFMVDPKLTPHHHHLKRAKSFHITCTLDPVTNKCKEFPESAESILQAVVSLYRSKLSANTDIAHGLEFHENISPQPSNTSSNSSNSDSGIGFRDEGNASDRVFIVDVDNYHQFSTNSLDRQAFAASGFGLLDSLHRPFSLSQDTPLLTSKSQASQFPPNENRAVRSPSPCQFDRLTVRAMPDAAGFDLNSAYDPEQAESQLSASLARNGLLGTMSVNQNGTNPAYHSNQLSSDSEENFQPGGASNVEDAVNELLSNSKMYKLSPKVYGVSFPLKTSNMLSCSAEWECTSCTDEMQSPTRHIMEGIYTTEQEEVGSQDVNPPTQEEDSESDAPMIEQDLHSASKWTRTSSLRRHLERKRSIHRSTHEAGTVSDGELASGKVSTSSSMLAVDHISDSSCHSSCTSERPVDVSRVGSWAAGFNFLLEDPAGLHTFSEFLKKEFSQENITFWIACERYRQLNDESKMVQMAKEIYSTHLCIGAQEPVNVDSHARQVAQNNLDAPTPDLFLPAQKQIFNLMKFDCYQRFLKSSMFKECVLREMQGQSLLYQGQAHLTHSVEKAKSKVCREEKKRRSLIPWHKLSKTKVSENGTKNGTNKIWTKHYEIRKSLKKKKDDYHKLDDTTSTQSDLASSRSSLAGSENGVGMKSKNISSRESLNSAELTLFPSRGTKDFFCRVILPDLSTTVVKTTKGETVGEMLLKLLERRSLTYNAVEAYLVGSQQPLDHCVDVTTLNCKEIRVEQVILFCLELPNMKRIGVKAKSNKLCGEILKPVLQKYGYKLDCVATTVASSKKPVSIHAPITCIDNERLIVDIKDKFSSVLPEWTKVKENLLGKDSHVDHALPNLEELTNQIFEDLLKSRPEFQFDGLGLIDLDGNIHDRGTSGSQCSEVFSHDCSDKALEKLDDKFKLTLEAKQKLNDIKSHLQSKALLPHNASSDNNIDLPDSCLPCIQGSRMSELEYDVALNNPAGLGKENCPIANKTDALDLKTESMDSKFCQSFLKNSDTVFRSDPTCSTLELSEGFFTSNCYANYECTKAGTSDRFLQSLDIVPSAAGSRKSKKMPLSSVSPSCLPPRLPPRYRTPKKFSVSCRDLSPTSAQRSSPSIDVDTTLTIDSSFDLDLDVDVTLRAQSASDDSLSPISFSLTSSQKTESEKHDLSKDVYQPSSEPNFMQIPLRRIACEPPPVPPKASARGPPPRPPSRQLNMNPVFGGTSEEDISEEEDIAKNSYIALGKEHADYNISFV